MKIKTAKQKDLLDDVLKEVLQQFPQVKLCILFGSLATGKQHPASDLDLAVKADHPLTLDEKIAIISALAERTGRPIDLIDLYKAPEPLLGQILKEGRRIIGNDTLYAQLISRHLVEQADFMPYQSRILAERRKKWIGK
jgi:predicted nucleotidyltransferase